MTAKPSGVQTRALAFDIVQTLFAELAPVCNAALQRVAAPPAAAAAIPFLQAPRVVPPEVLRRFWGNVAKAGDDECWIWNGTVGQHGYGRFCYDYKHLLAHRFAYEISVGPIPEGLWILHSCDRRRCQNPRHLRPGTPEENIADTVNRRRHHHGESHRNAKLTAEAVRDIRSSQETNEALARKYGVVRATIHSVRVGRTWGLLDNPPASGAAAPKRKAKAKG